MKYRCKEAFLIDLYDDDGFSLEEQRVVEVGEVFKTIESSFRIAGGSDTIHLENDLGDWLELLSETIDGYFDEVNDGD